MILHDPGGRRFVEDEKLLACGDGDAVGEVEIPEQQSRGIFSGVVHDDAAVGSAFEILVPEILEGVLGGGICSK